LKRANGGLVPDSMSSLVPAAAGAVDGRQLWLGDQLGGCHHARRRLERVGHRDGVAVLRAEDVDLEDLSTRALQHLLLVWRRDALRRNAGRIASVLGAVEARIEGPDRLRGEVHDGDLHRVLPRLREVHRGDAEWVLLGRLGDQLGGRSLRFGRLRYRDRLVAGGGHPVGRNGRWLRVPAARKYRRANRNGY
jgi:hypothetical protein